MFSALSQNYHLLKKKKKYASWNKLSTELKYGINGSQLAKMEK